MRVGNHIKKIEELVGDKFHIHKSSHCLIFRRFDKIYRISLDTRINAVKDDLVNLIEVFCDRGSDYDYLVEILEILRPFIDRKAKIDKFLKEIEN